MDLNGFEYIKENISNCKVNGNVIFLEEELEFVLNKTFEELDIVYESLKR